MSGGEESEQKTSKSSGTCHVSHSDQVTVDFFVLLLSAKCTSFTIHKSLTNCATEYANVIENMIKITEPVLEANKEPMIQPYFCLLLVCTLFILFFTQIHFLK